MDEGSCLLPVHLLCVPPRSDIEPVSRLITAHLTSHYSPSHVSCPQMAGRDVIGPALPPRLHEDSEEDSASDDEECKGRPFYCCSMLLCALCSMLLCTLCSMLLYTLCCSMLSVTLCCSMLCYSMLCYSVLSVTLCSMLYVALLYVALCSMLYVALCTSPATPCISLS